MPKGLRNVLQVVLTLGLALVFGLAPPIRAEETVIRDRFGRHFQGETCISCHDGRAGEVPERVPRETYDTVVIGGGMAGLSTLHYLKDRNVLLLEVEDEPGGQMREAEWKGIKYAIGAAYMVVPYGVMRDFYKENGIELIRIRDPENSAWIDGKYYPNCWNSHGRHKMPWKGDSLKNWVKWLEEMEVVNDTNMSNQPWETFDPQQQDLDFVSTHDYLKQKGISDDAIHHLDRYIPSCFGALGDKISAAAFVNYISAEISGNYTFPGGLGRLTRMVYENLKDKVRLGCRVVKVSQNLSGARVTYLDTRTGRYQTVGARTVVAAVPGMILPHIIPDLPEEKKKAIAGIEYASYIVANVLVNEVIWDDKGYDTWINGTFFKDIIDASWITRKGKPFKDKKQPQVLTLYIPSGKTGMWEVLDWPPEKIKEAILTDLEKIIPGSRAKVHDVEISRFGHSMHVADVGFLHQKVPVLRKPWYRIAFAGAEVEGLPCNESAIISGYKAANYVRTWLWDQSDSLEAKARLTMDSKPARTQTPAAATSRNSRSASRTRRRSSGSD